MEKIGSLIGHTIIWWGLQTFFVFAGEDDEAGEYSIQVLLNFGKAFEGASVETPSYLFGIVREEDEYGNIRATFYSNEMNFLLTREQYTILLPANQSDS